MSTELLESTDALVEDLGLGPTISNQASSILPVPEMSSVALTPPEAMSRVNEEYLTAATLDALQILAQPKEPAESQALVEEAKQSLEKEPENDHFCFLREDVASLKSQWGRVVQSVQDFKIYNPLHSIKLAYHLSTATAVTAYQTLMLPRTLVLAAGASVCYLGDKAVNAAGAFWDWTVNNVFTFRAYEGLERLFGNKK